VIYGYLRDCLLGYIEIGLALAFVAAAEDVFMFINFVCWLIVYFLNMRLLKVGFLKFTLKNHLDYL